MKLTALGVYGGYPAPGGGTAGYLLRTDSASVMLDFGAGALSRVQGYVPPEKLSAIVLSHLHSDHACDMLNLRYYFQLNFPNFRLPVYLPESRDPLFSMIADCPAFELHAIAAGKTHISGLEFEFLPMTHPVPTFGMRVSAEGKVLAYTADTTENPNLEILARGCDLLLADGALTREDWRPGTPHLPAETAAELAARCGCRLLYTHLMKAEPARLIAAARGFGVEAGVLAEFMTYDI